MTVTASQISEARDRDIVGIARAHGVKLNGRGRNLSGPCPRCGGTDRFAIDAGRQLFNCRGCNARGKGAIDIVKFLDHCTFVEAVERLVAAGIPIPPQAPSRADHDRRQHARAAWLWRKRQPIAGSPAERYLREARGYHGSIPATLAYLPPSKPKHHPALIAALGLCDEIEPGILVPPRQIMAVHLTLLQADGSGKANVEHPKLINGTPSGLPIALAPPNDLLGLAITEGIEDGLSAHEATGLGAWAAYSAGNMEKLAPSVPGYIEVVTIYAHDDDNGIGQGAAHALAEALTERGIETFIEGIGQ